MKRRASFVANSSSSSFLIFGVKRSTFNTVFPNADSNDIEDMDLREIEGIVGSIIFYDDEGSMENDAMVKKVTTANAKLEENGITGGKFYYGVEY